MTELEVKTERLVRMLAAENLGGVLLNTQHNFAWLTGGGSNGIDLSRENGAGFLFVTGKGKRYVIANNIEIGRLLAEEISAEDFEPIEIGWQAEKDPGVVIKAAKRAAGAGELGCDIGFPEARWVEPSIAACRFELVPEEIERYRELGRAAGRGITITHRFFLRSGAGPFPPERLILIRSNAESERGEKVRRRWRFHECRMGLLPSARSRSPARRALWHTAR
ncbi:MAG: hypothetical protein ABJB34_00650 [Acidobacteriota bacterium]